MRVQTRCGPRLVLGVLLAAGVTRAQPAGSPPAAVRSATVAPGPSSTGAVVMRSPSLPIELVWRAPADCQKHRSVLSEVARLIPSDVTPRQMRALANVTSDSDGRWHVTLTFEGGVRGRRRLHAVSCESLVEAVSVIVALASTGEAVADAVPEPEPEPKPVEVEPLPEEEPPPSTPLPESGLAVALAGRYESGTAPGAPGGHLAAWLFNSHGQVGLEVGALASSSSAVSEPEARAKFRLGWLEARGCANLLRRALKLSLCGLYRMARLTAEAEGPEVEQSQEQVTLYAPGAGVRAEWTLFEWFGLVGGVDALLPLSRPAFVIQSDIDGSETSRHVVYKPRTVTPSAYLGLVLTPMRF